MRDSVAHRQERYLDHNATTPLDEEVAAFLKEALTVPTNPSSVHARGRAARQRLDRARARVAQVLGCEPKEVVFTASGSEANALAILGTYRARTETSRTKIVSSALEHPALLAAGKQAEREGAKLELLPPAATGRLDEARLLEALTPETHLCSLQWANNETGVLQPARAAARACRERGILFHTDAVQAIGKVPVSLREVDADLLTLSAHKFGGPPGVAILIVRKSVTLEPLVPGHQEDGRRGGTQNVLYAEACALALEVATRKREATAAALRKARDHFETHLRQRLSGIVIHGDTVDRVPNTSSVRFAEKDGEALLIALDLEGYQASMGAACASGTLKPSHVLKAMGLMDAQARATLRFSFGEDFDEAAADELVETLVTLYGRL